MKLALILGTFLFSLVGHAGQLVIESAQEQISAKDYVYYDFGMVMINTRVAVRYTVTNTGATPLTYKDDYISGMGFQGAHSCNTVLQPKQKCQFEISFWPYFEGFSSGRFVIDFVENDNITIDLRGQGRR